MGARRTSSARTATGTGSFTVVFSVGWLLISPIKITTENASISAGAITLFAAEGLVGAPSFIFDPS
jgi:hypothetical protein